MGFKTSHRRFSSLTMTSPTKINVVNWVGVGRENWIRDDGDAHITPYNSMLFTAMFKYLVKFAKNFKIYS